ncbi:MAG TPA: T9SS type A sorting domain-containing protein [Flavobacterium sp.]|nr:T9SS type A sorting domain-containing protein [Flavobacterium sp.]
MKKKSLLLIMMSSFAANAQFWSEKATGFATPARSLNSISIVDANVIWANAFDNTVQLDPSYTIKEFTRSTDGGDTWTAGSINLGPDSTDMGSSSITAVSSTTAWISVSPGAINTGGIWKTIDGGTNWTKQPTALFNSADSYPNFVYFWDANNGIAQGDPESGEFEIYTTTDGGTNWTRVPGANIPDPSPIGNEFGYFNRYSVSGNTIWFGTDKGRIFKSSDKGLTWSVNLIPTPSTDFGLDRFTFSDANKGLLMLYSSVTLYSTNDGGATWNLVPKTGDLFNTNINYIPGTSTVISSAYANPLGSSYSLDDGLNWITIDSGVFHGELAFLSDSFGFSAGMNTNATTGGISKFTGIPLKNPSFDNTKQIAAYPNPTNGTLYLKSETSLIKEASVFDLLGKQVYKSNFSAINNVNLDLKSLQTGAYLLKVTSDSGKTETMKIMKN